MGQSPKGTRRALSEFAHLAAARAGGRIGGRRKKLDLAKRREIAEGANSVRQTGGEMAHLYNVSAPTGVAAHRRR